MTASNNRIIQITVPENFEPGDSLSFQIDGCNLDVIVPLHSKAGDILEIQIGDANQPLDQDQSVESMVDHDAGGGDHSSGTITKVKLDSGEILDIFTSDENIEDESDVDGTCYVPWSAGIHLAQFLSSQAATNILQDVHRVVELGSGLGIGGLGLCSSLSQIQLDHKVGIIFTDLPTALPLIHRNILVNKMRFNGLIETHVEPLVWGLIEMTPRFELPVDLIIASDLLYNSTESVYKNLADSICSLLQPSHGSKHTQRLILSVRWRKPDLERRFFEIMEHRGILLQLVTSFRGGCNHLSWKDFGNVNCDQSNSYFRETMIRAQGSTVSLENVTEDHIQQMSDEEYTFFESKYIQIYSSAFY